MRGRKGPSWKVQVNCTQEKAYAYVADIHTHPDWAMDDMTVKGPDGPAAVGTTWETEGTLFGKRNPSKVTFTALNPSSSLEFEAADATSNNGHVFTFTAQDGGTLVTRQLYSVQGPWYGPILFLAFMSSINKNFNGALAKLKERLES